MSIHKTDILILAIPVSHKKATLLNNEIYSNYNYEDDNEIFMFTDNQNMYKDVGYSYDEDEKVPHYIGIEITEDKSEINKYINADINQDKYIINKFKIFKEQAMPILEKYDIDDREPSLILVSQIG